MHTMSPCAWLHNHLPPFHTAPEQIDIALDHNLLTQHDVPHLVRTDQPASLTTTTNNKNTHAVHVNVVPVPPSTMLFADAQDVLGPHPMRTTSIDAVLFAGDLFDFDCMVNGPVVGQLVGQVPLPGGVGNAEGLRHVFGSGSLHLSGSLGSGALHMSGTLDDDVLLVDVTHGCGGAEMLE